MSRHRNIRSMRYSDEYDGYDDVYGHSVEDDYSISPSDAAFMYDRSNQQHQLSSLIRSEDDIAEEDESLSDDKVPENLNELDKAKLMSCLEEIRNVLGETIPEPNLIKAVMDSNFDVTVALDSLLNSTTNKKPKQDKIGETTPKPQRTNTRQRGKGGKQRSNIKTNSKSLTSFELKANKKNSESQNQVFDVVQFLKSDKRSFEFDLFRGYIKPGEKLQPEPEIIEPEKSVLDLLPKDEIKKLPEVTENMFVLKSMPVEALQRAGPSKLGYFVCKKLIEVKSNSNCKLGQIDYSKIKIVPFKFDSKSPDDIGLMNRKWF